MKPIRAWCFSGCSATAVRYRRGSSRCGKIAVFSTRSWRASFGSSGRLGATDRHVLGDYLDSVRDVKCEYTAPKQANETTPLPAVEQPSGIPEEYDAHARLLMDLLHLALSRDVTVSAACRSDAS